jgi:hypothetical protein
MNSVGELPRGLSPDVESRIEGDTELLEDEVKILLLSGTPGVVMRCEDGPLSMPGTAGVGMGTQSRGSEVTVDVCPGFLNTTYFEQKITIIANTQSSISPRISITSFCFHVVTL